MSKQKDYIEDINPQAERRYYVAPVEARLNETSNDSDKMYEIEGMAARVNSRTNLGWFDEVIEPGAFDDVLNDDVRCLFNHNPDLILARTTSGTLNLSLDTNGNLMYKYKTPNRSYAIDLQDAILKGDVSQCSFAFIIKEASWEYAQENGKNDLRKIIKIDSLLDVSPVTYPAYADTKVAARSYKHEDNAGQSGLDVYKSKVKLSKFKKK